MCCSDPSTTTGFFMTRARSSTTFPTPAIIGMGKFVDEEMLIELLPGMEDDIKAACDSTGEPDQQFRSRHQLVSGQRRLQAGPAGRHLVQIKGRLELGAVHRLQDPDAGRHRRSWTRTTSNSANI